MISNCKGTNQSTIFSSRNEGKGKGRGGKDFFVREEEKKGGNNHEPTRTSHAIPTPKFLIESIGDLGADYSFPFLFPLLDSFHPSQSLFSHPLFFGVS